MKLDDFAAEIEARYPEVAAVAHEVDPPFVLALNVMNLRRERGITQAQLAAAIGVSQPRIAELEAGDANPRLVTLSKIAHALGVTLAELMTDHQAGPHAERVSAARERISGAMGQKADEPRRRRAK